jgi:hypothetical protein
VETLAGKVNAAIILRWLEAADKLAAADFEANPV